jgi:hypothetical protein
MPGVGHYIGGQDLLNDPQFSNPDTNFTSATFGVISSTAVNPRVTQLALKLVF